MTYLPNVEYRCSLFGCAAYKPVDTGPPLYPTQYPPPTGWIAVYTVTDAGTTSVDSDFQYFCSWGHAADFCGRRRDRKAVA